MDTVILFRIAERLTLTAVVLLVALVVMIGFWRTVQKLTLSDSAPLGLGGSFVFSTPVFVLLALIGYSWVSLEHPITVASPPLAPFTTQQTSSLEGLEVPAETPTYAGTFAGSIPAFTGSEQTFLGTDPEDLGTPDPGYEIAKAQRQIRSLNCLIEGQTLSNRADIDITDIKLALMSHLWQPVWGNEAEFAQWAQGMGDFPPHDDAHAAWVALHPLC